MVNVLQEDYQHILRHLVASGLDFILIGGYAVIAHGYERTTGDMDIWVRPDNENKMVLLKALRELGFDEGDIAFLAAQNFEEAYAFCLGEEPMKIDFLTKIYGVNYPEANAQKIEAEIDGIRLPILHLNHLVISKFNTGRSKDKADIEELQRIEAARHKGNA